MSNSTDEIKSDDPHASKIDPDDPRLLMNQKQRTSRKIKKGAVVGAFFVVVGILLLGLIFALQPAKSRIYEDETALEEKSKYVQVPDSIAKAPAFIPVPGQVPALGAPLPGDIGATMVKPVSVVNSGATPSGPSPEEQLRIERLKKAMMAGPTFSAFGAADQSPGGSGNSTSGTAYRPDTLLQEKLLDSLGQSGSGEGMDSVAAQNMQDEKREFVADSGINDANYLKNSLTWPRSKFEVKAGAIIPVSLITGINSDLPGDIIGQVRENVYDTVTGNHLLVPQGSKVMAQYDSIITYGQERALVCWNRLIRPDGSSIDLECSPGVDLAGYAGVSDEVDNHWFRLVGGIVLSSVLSATTAMSQGDIDGYHPSWSQSMAAGAGEEINNAGRQITEKNLNIQPTIKVRPGFSVNVLVNKDIILTPYER